MQKSKFLKSMQRYVANVAISGSTLRNQGAKRVVTKARDFLAKLKLSPLSTLSPSDYPAWLDRNTVALRRHLPTNARKWGAARKAINIFTICSPQVEQMYEPSSVGRRRFFFLFFMSTPAVTSAARSSTSRPHRQPLWTPPVCGRRI